MRTTGSSVFALAFALWTSGCDPSLTFEAKAGCPGATPNEEREGPDMLPGRECISCHRGFSAAGTVFATLNATCDTGVEGVKIEIMDLEGNAKVTLMSNAVGNFYTKAKLPSPFRARVTGPNGEVQESPTEQETDTQPETQRQTEKKTHDEGNCSRCHRLPAVEGARGRLSLFVPPRDPGTAAAGSGAD